MNSSRWLTWLGVVISLVGVVDLIWTQMASKDILNEAVFRWSEASGGVSLIALGVLVGIAAQIMGMMQAAAQRQSSN